jgi:predicted amidophosphoribosyltransferase
MIAEGIANITKTPIITDAVIRKIYTNTQTRKNKEERAENVQGIVEVVDCNVLENKHILILDDVITTGATCISCAETILKQSNVKSVSFASVALAN